MIATVEIANPTNADTQRMPDIIEVIVDTNSGGGGETSGLSEVCRWIARFIMSVIGPDIHRGTLRANRPDTPYHAATAYCIGFVHGVGTRGVAGGW